jgi:hypothetical protein
MTFLFHSFLLLWLFCITARLHTRQHNEEKNNAENRDDGTEVRFDDQKTENKTGKNNKTQNTKNKSRSRDFYNTHRVRSLPVWHNVQTEDVGPHCESTETTDKKKQGHKR